MKKIKAATRAIILTSIPLIALGGAFCEIAGNYQSNSTPYVLAWIKGFQ